MCQIHTISPIMRKEYPEEEEKTLSQILGPREPPCTRIRVDK